MPPGESSCPGGSECVCQRGVEGVKGWFTGGPSLPYFLKKREAYLRCHKKMYLQKNLQNWACKLISFLPIDYGKKSFKFGSSNWKIFVTPLNFANGPHFVALTRLWATHLSYIFSESWVCMDSVVTCPEKFSGTERFTENFRFSLITLSIPQTKVWGSCTHNYDATDLPNS